MKRRRGEDSQSKVLLLLQARPAASLPMVGRERSDTVAANGGSEHVGELSEERSKGEKTHPVKNKGFLDRSCEKDSGVHDSNSSDSDKLQQDTRTINQSWLSKGGSLHAAD